MHNVKWIRDICPRPGAILPVDSWPSRICVKHYWHWNLLFSTIGFPSQFPSFFQSSSVPSVTSLGPSFPPTLPLSSVHIWSNASWGWIQNNMEPLLMELTYITLAAVKRMEALPSNMQVFSYLKTQCSISTSFSPFHQFKATSRGAISSVLRTPLHLLLPSLRFYCQPSLQILIRPPPEMWVELCPSPSPLYLRMGPYLEIVFVDVMKLKWSHIELGWALIQWLVSLQEQRNLNPETYREKAMWQWR